MIHMHELEAPISATKLDICKYKREEGNMYSIVTLVPKQI